MWKETKRLIEIQVLGKKLPKASLKNESNTVI